MRTWHIPGVNLGGPLEGAEVDFGGVEGAIFPMDVDMQPVALIFDGDVQIDGTGSARYCTGWEDAADRVEQAGIDGLLESLLIG